MDDRIERRTFRRTRTISGAFQLDLIDGAIEEIVESNGRSGEIRWNLGDFIPMALWEVHGLPANRVFLDRAEIEVQVRVSADFTRESGSE